MKNELRVIGNSIMANGKIEGHEVELLRSHLSADGVIDRQEAEFLVDMFRRTNQIAPAFEKFFYQTIKKHLVADGRVGAEEALWLRRVIFSDGVVKEREKKLLRELRGESKEFSDEAQALFDECLV
jgi:uncharacterized tellurite resistance protein B-like protein